MKKLYLLLLGLLPLFAIGQCPDCNPDETCVSEDPFPTLCPLILPDATAGAYYETVVTFYMPGTIEDPDSGIEVELQQITVGSVSGLPFGIDYTVNDEDGTYFPSAGENYGCATLCGIPLIQGEYEVVISVDVLVIALGFEQAVQESFSLPLTVLPGEGGNSSFAYDNLFGCGSVSSTFNALIDGAPGITSYDWDFGNGETSDLADPPTQTFDAPGDYTVSLSTTIENYVLNSVTANDFDDGDWCGDIEEPGAFGICTGNPDPYFVLADANGNVYTSSSLDNTESGSWNNLGIVLDNPPYTITFWDEDTGPPLGSQDDNMGTVNINLQAGDQSVSGGGAQGAVSLSIEVTENFFAEETVQVWPLPNASFDFIEVPAPGILDITDEEVSLTYWLLNGDTIQAGPQDSILLDAPGVYQAIAVNEFGCESTSETFTLCPQVELTFNGGAGTLSAPAGFESYTWEYNGAELPDTGNSINASLPGNYQVTITTDYGCEVESELFTVTNITEAKDAALKVYPNPASSHVFADLPQGTWNLELTDASGRVIERLEDIQGNRQVLIPVAHLAHGTYMLRADNGQAVRVARILR